MDAFRLSHFLNFVVFLDLREELGDSFLPHAPATSPGPLHSPSPSKRYLTPTDLRKVPSSLPPPLRRDSDSRPELSSTPPWTTSAGSLVARRSTSWERYQGTPRARWPKLSRSKEGTLRCLGSAGGEANVRTTAPSRRTTPNSRSRASSSPPSYGAKKAPSARV